jgi:hypothetical protein
MKPTPSSQPDKQDREVIKLLEELGSIKSEYPLPLRTARRAAFLMQVDQLTTAEIGGELSAGDQEIIRLLGTLKSSPVEYPPALLAARRSALLRQIGQAKAPRLWDEIRRSTRRIFPDTPTIPAWSGFARTSLVIASLIVLAFFGSLIFNRTEQGFQLSPSQNVPSPTNASTGIAPTRTGETAILICKPDAVLPTCLLPSQDLAKPRNGTAQPAVSNRGDSKAAYVNDGREGTGWVSTNPDSWIKIDLGQVRIINTISLKSGSSDSSDANTPGQFVIAVALSDMYADGDSSHDDAEYAQVFHSEQMGFSGKAAQMETIQTKFPLVQARYVKITFKKAGAAIDEVGVFMVEPPAALTELPTRTSPSATPGSALTPGQTNTVSSTGTAATVSIATGLPTETAIPTLTDTAALADTPTPLLTNTLPPADTATSAPTEPLPTVAPPTAIPPTSPPSPTSPARTDPIVVTGNGQTLTFTCNGNDATIRGHENTVTLLGSCSSITVTGNGNRVFWQYGSPVVTNRGRDNIILQL